MTANVLRWKGAAAAIAVITAALLAVDSAPWPVSPSAAPAAAPSATAPAAETPTPTPLVESASGLRVLVPDGWMFNDEATMVNRAIVRHFFVSSQPVVPPPPTASWDQVPADAVALELWEYAGPPAIAERAPETDFPLNWGDATALADQSGTDARRLAFQHAFRPLAFVAHVGRDARPQDRAAVERIVSSVRPIPVPERGAYLGAYVAGALRDLPVGSVTRAGVGPPRAAMSVYIVRGQRNVFAFYDRAFSSYGGMFRCPLRYDDEQRSFICDASGDRWDRVGNPLTAEAQFSLEWAPTAVRDGKVLVRPSRIGGAFMRDEKAEFTDGAAPVTATVLAREEIVHRALSLASDGSQSEARAKLVSRDELLRSNAYSGLRFGDDPIWVVVVTRDPRTVRPDPRSAGDWTMFAFDGRGRLLAVSCCEAGGPPGVAALADTAGPADAVAPRRDCGPTNELPLTWDAAARQCAWDAYSAGERFRWKLTANTVEGDPIPIVVTFDGAALHLTRDMRADEWSAPQDRRVSEWTCRTMTKRPWATDASRYFFELADCTGATPRTSIP